MSQNTDDPGIKPGYDPSEQGSNPRCADCNGVVLWVEADKDAAHGPSYEGWECGDCGATIRELKVVEDR